MPSKSWHIKGFNGFAPKDSHRIVNGNLWGLVIPRNSMDLFPKKIIELQLVVICGSNRFMDHHDKYNGGFEPHYGNQ